MEKRFSKILKLSLRARFAGDRDKDGEREREKERGGNNEERRITRGERELYVNSHYRGSH